MVNFRLLVCSLSLITVFGCGGSKRQFEVAEVVTVEAQALSDVRSTPTTFAIEPSEDPQTWTRAKIFFENYGGGRPVLGAGEMRSAPKTTSQVRYKVRKKWDGERFRYTITSHTPGVSSSQEKLMLYAKNFSRFLQTGYLELSLVH